MTALDRLSFIWKLDLNDKFKCNFFHAAVLSILIYGCTTWKLTKCLEQKLGGNYTRMLRAVLNKSWRPYLSKQQLYGHVPPITKTIKTRLTRHAGHTWRSKNELLSHILLWTPSHGQAKAGQSARTYIQQLYARKTSRERWTIEMGGQESGRSLLAAWKDDDDDTF